MPSSDPLVKFKVQTMPSSIDSIIRLMDTLQPNCHYFDRVKTKSRGDCSQLRSKLRKFANANKNKSGVKHWVDSKKWTPPNNKALSALMVIIRDIINTSWPLLEENPNPTKRQKVDIPTLTEDEKKVVLTQYKKDNANDSAEAVLAEYEKFMYIKIKGGGDNCTPSKKVDAMWHAHILSTREYVAFCERYNNKEYIHHNPALTNGRESYKGTLLKYKEYFGHAPSSTTIWPGAIGIEQEHEDEEEEEDEQQEEEDEEEGEEEEREDYLGLKQMKGESWDDYTNRWHTTYANRYREHPNRVYAGCGHDWDDGKFDIECEDCVCASMDIEHDDEPDLESPFGRGITCG